MYKFEMCFLNTFNSAVIFSPDGKNIRDNNTCLEAHAASAYLKEKKLLLQSFANNFKTELVITEDYIYCFASIRNTKILFNLIPLASTNISTNSGLKQLEIVYNINEENILGKYKALLPSGFPFEFRIINTCNSFLDFVKSNGGYPTRKMNIEFLAAFEQSLKAINNNIITPGSVCKLQSTENPHIFKFINIYDLIIIIDYHKANKVTYSS
ncbi:hypothetical protein NBE98_04530 [Clostridium swellfunianum]|uniref:hypothetical protein n=1 Tax=Clostridium swellfunianum TaxID=1367462 RepID=UPI00202DC8CA|nr:hypothetical protein [Clostridium swellfunianum]MCM0647647.1 hypothetical protein [Clostridium swellfunianum]